MKRQRWLMLLLLLVAALAVAGCGDDDDDDGGGESAPAGESAGIKKNNANASTTLTIGSKNFTEQKILGEIYAQALEAGGYKIRKRLDLGSEKVAFRAVKAGRIDAYPEYTGTALTTFFGIKTS